MSNIIDLRKTTDLQQIADTIRNWLIENNNWDKQFTEYAKKINQQESNITNIIKVVKKNINKIPNLNLYASISGVTNNKSIDIRYKGQSIAYLKNKNEILTLYTTKEQTKTNKTYLNWSKKLDCAWDSSDAVNFRNYFSLNIEKKGQVEHRFESMLIEEFAKQVSKDKKLCNIQPVKLYKELAFQMPTVLSASGKTISLSKSARAGGIDILARVKHGAQTNLCVIELKKDFIQKEQDAHIIRGQGLAYAVFLRELLRSSSGKDWYKIFGYEKELPNSLTIDVCIAVPKGNSELLPENQIVQIEKDKIHFKYICFETKEIITSITSDLFS